MSASTATTEKINAETNNDKKTESVNLPVAYKQLAVHGIQIFDQLLENNVINEEQYNEYITFYAVKIHLSGDNKSNADKKEYTDSLPKDVVVTKKMKDEMGADAPEGSKDLTNAYKKVKETVSASVKAHNSFLKKKQREADKLAKQEAKKEAKMKTTEVVDEPEKESSEEPVSEEPVSEEPVSEEPVVETPQEEPKKAKKTKKTTK